MYNALVADDEPLAREELKYLLTQSGEVEVIAEVESGEEALQTLENISVDVVFLDIQMFGEDGLKVANKIKSKWPDTIIIFVTAYEQYAVKAFELNAADYLLKPFSEERLMEALMRIKTLKGRMEEKITNKKNQLCFQGKDRIFCLNPKEIFYFEATGRNCFLGSKIEKIFLRHSISEIEKKLSEYNFLRVHKSFLVNLDVVREIVPLFHGYVLKLDDAIKTEIPVGRTFIKSFKDKIGI